MKDTAISTTVEPRAARRWPLALAIISALVIWCSVDVQRRGRIDPEHPERHRTDFTVYTEAGGAFFDGRDPYQVTSIRGWYYLYPPMFALLVAPLSFTSGSVQVSVWFFCCALFTWGCYVEMSRWLRALAKLRGDEHRDGVALPRWIVIAALAVAVLPALNTMQRGQVDLLKLYLMLLGFRLAIVGGSKRSWFAGGAALGASIVLKVLPVLPTAFMLMLFVARRIWQTPGDRQPLVRASTVTAGLLAGVAALLIFVPATLLGWQKNLGYVQTFFQQRLLAMGDGKLEDPAGNSRTLRNQSMANATIRLGNFLSHQFLGGPDDRLIDRAPRNCPTMAMDSRGVARVILLARLSLGVLLLAVGLKTVARGDALAQSAALGLACVVTLMISPIGRGSYFTELAPATALVPWWLLQCGRTRAAKFAAWTPVALVWLHYCALPLTARMGVLGLGTTVWCTTCLGLLWIVQSSDRGKESSVASSSHAIRPHVGDARSSRRPLTQEYA